MLLAVCHNYDNGFEALSIGGVTPLVAVVCALSTYYTEFLMLIFTLFIHIKLCYIMHWYLADYSISTVITTLHNVEYIFILIVFIVT